MQLFNLSLGNECLDPLGDHPVGLPIALGIGTLERAQSGLMLVLAPRAWQFAKQNWSDSSSPGNALR